MDEVALKIMFGDCRFYEFTVILAISKTGFLLKPYISLWSQVEVEDWNGEGGRVLELTNTGRIDVNSLIWWTTKCLIPFTNQCCATLIFNKTQLHSKSDFRDLLRKNKVQVMELPAGLNCILNPLKPIIQFMKKYLHISAKEIKKVTTEILAQLIINGLLYITHEKPILLYEAFNCLSLYNYPAG